MSGDITAMINGVTGTYTPNPITGMSLQTAVMVNDKRVEISQFITSGVATAKPLGDILPDTPNGPLVL